MKTAPNNSKKLTTNNFKYANMNPIFFQFLLIFFFE